MIAHVARANPTASVAARPNPAIADQISQRVNAVTKEVIENLKKGQTRKRFYVYSFF